jgi:hypothetical protein
MFAGIVGSKTARLVPLALVLAVGLGPLALADEAADPPGRVARVNQAVGTVSLQPAGSEAWVSDVLNRPLTNGDKLWADRESRAELHIGSNTVRLGSETGTEILNVDDRTVQLKLSAGTLQVRVRVLDPEQTFEIATPTASVAVLRPGTYRVEVGESDGLLRIAVAQGQVAVTDQGHEATVEAGQLAEYNGGPVDQAQLSALPPGDAFDQWAADRDRREDRAVATRYVSREVIGYEDLDDNGSWQTADEYGPVWVPRVQVGWAPYRYGHWGWIAPWGWTWIDDAPWGFAPFHYGRWVFYGGNWCWAPGPRRYAPVYAPALVGWVGGSHWAVGVSIGGGGPPVGWFPLGWNEVYVPAYRVSNNYVRNVNVTNIHVTNTVINNYITNNTTIVNGRRTVGDGAPEGRKYANFAVPGAVTATTHAAFTGAQPVGSHLAKMPRESLERAAIGATAPAIAPTAGSLGRPAAAVPRPAAGMWSLPVVARTPTPPPPPSFEAQRHAIVANGGRPVPARAVTPGPAAGAGRGPAAVNPRADVIPVGPATPPRPAERAPVTPPPNVIRPREGRAVQDRPGQERPVTPQAPPAYRPPAAREPAPAAARPAPDYRTAPPHETNARPAPEPTPRPTPDYRPPAVREPAPAAARPAPEPASRPAPEYRPPAVREPAPAATRPAPEYRAAPPREPVVRPAPEPAQRPTPEYRPPVVREPAPVPPAAREAPRPAPEFRPPPPREAAPVPREAHPAPPPPKPEKGNKPEQHDKR